MSAERLAELQAAAERARGDALIRLGDARASSILRGSSELVTAYRALAITGFFRDADIDGFHQRMHLAACARRRFFACLDRGLRCAAGHPLRAIAPALEEALAGGEPRVLADLASIARSSTEREAPEARLLAGLASVVLGEMDDAAAALVRFDAVRGPEQEGHARMLGGLIRSDEAAFDEGLGAALDARRAAPPDVDAPLSVWLAVDLLGYVRLAQRQGLTNMRADPAIPDELQGAPTAPYPDPGAVFPALPAEIVDDLPRAPGATAPRGLGGEAPIGRAPS